MPAVLRLAISALSGRRKRIGLLTAAVALSSLLVAAVTTATSSIERSLEARIEATVGRAQAKLEPSSGRGGLGVGVSKLAEGWPEVERVIERIRSSVSVESALEDADGVTRSFWSTALGIGVDAEEELASRPVEMIAGRLPASPGEVAIDEALAARLAGRSFAGGMMAGNTGQVYGGDEDAEVVLNVSIGDRVRLRRLFSRSDWYDVVGVVRQPPLGGRPRAYFTIEGIAWANDGRTAASEIDLILKPSSDPDAFVARVRPELDEAFDKGVLIQTSARITSGLEQNLKSSRVGSLVGSLLAFLSAGFIIMTGLTVDVAQRQRELAMVRCIGGTKRQLALSQLLVGGFIGGVGALVGIPGGVLATWGLVSLFSDHLGVGLHISPFGLTLAGLGSVIAGIAGAAWPAWKAASTSPLRALSPQASAVRVRGIVITSIVGLSGVLLQLATVAAPDSGRIVFWAYLTVGLPAMFVGYFMLGVPAVLLIARWGGTALDRVLGLPRGVLRRTIEAAPYRYGFTTGAMMGGLALMLAIWAQGGAVMRDWLDKLAFPDAFVYGLSLAPETQQRLEDLPFVNGTAAITVHPIETDAFGVQGLTSYRSSFIAFEPESFFEMATLDWVQGNPAEAQAKLEAGGSIIVAREFMVAQGLEIGDTFTCRNALGEDRTEHSFEIVGVVSSPGLDIVSTFFNIGENYTEQALHAVFGSRDDLRSRFGSDAVQLIQVEIDEGFDDQEAIDVIKAELFDTGILEAGSGRAIKQELKSVVSNTMFVSTVIAIGSMIVASFGVANLIIASVDARRYELGVFRSIGAGRAALARVVLGESAIVGLAACVLGFLLHAQGAFAGRKLYQTLLGLDLQVYIPWNAVALGCFVVISVCVLAAVPAAWGVLRKRPRELLAAR